MPVIKNLGTRGFKSINQLSSGISSELKCMILGELYAVLAIKY